MTLELTVVLTVVCWWIVVPCLVVGAAYWRSGARVVSAPPPVAARPCEGRSHRSVGWALSHSHALRPE
jgi:hypothetical protein